VAVLAVYGGRKSRNEQKNKEPNVEIISLLPNQRQNRRKGSSPAAFPRHQRCWQELYLLLRKPAVYGWRAVFLFDDEMILDVAFPGLTLTQNVLIY
jgi:hypothetical protein